MKFPHDFWRRNQVLLEHRFGTKQEFKKFIVEEGYGDGFSLMVITLSSGGKTVIVVPRELQSLLTTGNANNERGIGAHKIKNPWHGSIKRWAVYMNIDGKSKNMGSYFTEEEAKEAYVNALRNKVVPVVEKYAAVMSERSIKIIKSYLKIK